MAGNTAGAVSGAVLNQLTAIKYASWDAERGGFDVKECFIDGTFASAKKGALALERLSGARAPRSWQLQTAILFLSPYAQQVLARAR